MEGSIVGEREKENIGDWKSGHFLGIWGNDLWNSLYSWGEFFVFYPSQHFYFNMFREAFFFFFPS